MIVEEKYKRQKADGSGSDSESSDETEDEDAFLATEDLDAKISETLNAIRSKDPRIYDQHAKFFLDKDELVPPRPKKERSMRLKDYHRERFLAGGFGASDSEGEENDVEKSKTYVEEQAELKENILAQINAAAVDASEGDDEEEGFLKPKARKEAAGLDKNGLHPSRAAAGALTITEEDVAKADQNPELYLSNFMASRGWIPPDGSNWEAFESDDGDSDLEKADEFEAAYNLRFEDPEKSNEVLKTYARDVAAAKSLRRENITGRKRKREVGKERKEQEKRERAEEKARLKKLRLEEAEDRLERIRKLAGTEGKRLTDDEMIKFLDEAWEDDKWEEQMKKRFGEDYYEEEDVDMKCHDGEEDSSSKNKPKKPEWDDDIDIGDLVKDNSTAQRFTVADLEEDDDEIEAENAADQEDDEGQYDDEYDDPRATEQLKSSKTHKKDRLAARKAAKQSRNKLEALIDTMVELETPASFTPSGRNKIGSETQGFRWRETSPTSFGMSARDILLAPSDKALNRFAGIKKFVPYKEQEAKESERKRLSKKGRLRKWRREVFGKEFEKTGPTFGLQDVEGEDDDGKARVVDLDIPEEGRSEKKKRNRKRGHKKVEA